MSAPCQCPADSMHWHGITAPSHEASAALRERLAALGIEGDDRIRVFLSFQPPQTWDGERYTQPDSPTVWAVLHRGHEWPAVAAAAEEAGCKPHVGSDDDGPTPTLRASLPDGAEFAGNVEGDDYLLIRADRGPIDDL